MTRKLTEKQKAFADYYIECLNATEAARKAGYSKNTVGAIGHENLKKPKIKEYIDKRLAEKDDERVAKQDEILEFLTAVMRNDTEYLEQYDPIEIRDRLKAAEKLGKRYAMFVDKQEIEHDINNVSSVEIELVDDES